METLCHSQNYSNSSIASKITKLNKRETNMVIVTPTTVLLWGALSSTVTAMGAMAAEAVTHQQQANVVGGEALVPLGILFTGISLTVALVWRVATQKHTMDLGIQELRHRIDLLEKTANGKQTKPK